MWDLMKHQGNTAIIQDGVRYSYEELNRLSEEIAQHAERGSLAFLVCTNSVGSIAGYLGFLRNHIVPVMVDAKIDRDFLRSLLETYHPAYLWLPDAWRGEFPEAEEHFRSQAYVLVKTDDPVVFPVHDDLALLITTSGSTGSPKLVRQSYQNLAANTDSIIEYLRITEQDRAITSLPMHYVYGLSVINTHICAGASLVVTEQNCYTKKFWELFNETGATSFAGVPFMYEMMDKLRITKKELPTLKTMTQAGGKLLPTLQEKFSEYALSTGRRFVVMYGASEATARMGYLPPERAIEKKGSMGIAIPGGRFELVDENGDVIEKPGAEGELVYYGANVTMGYSERGEDLVKGDENHGRLATGDIACRDEDGFYYIVGRKKRFVKMLGKRLNLDELERMLKKQCDAIEIACGGKDDMLKVFVTDEALREPITSFITEKTSVNRNLFQVILIDQIPKNSAGKTLYSELNNMG